METGVPDICLHHNWTEYSVSFPIVAGARQIQFRIALAACKLGKTEPN